MPTTGAVVVVIDLEEEVPQTQVATWAERFRAGLADLPLSGPGLAEFVRLENRRKLDEQLRRFPTFQAVLPPEMRSGLCPSKRRRIAALICGN